MSAPYDDVTDRAQRAWLLMLALAVFVLVVATAFAGYQARRLAWPLERLTSAAQALGDGDFTIRAPRSGVRETDAAGRALEATAHRLGDMLERERAFSADVSHQLRTRLTGMLLGLESALQRPDGDLRGAIATALDRGERLQDVIDDLVRLARHNEGGREELDVPALLTEVGERWRGLLAADSRRLSVDVHEPVPAVRAAAAAIRQVVDVLVDNAVTHGSGQVTVTAVDVGGGLAIDVADEGPGVPDGDQVFTRSRSPGEGHGIGLRLARSLAEAEGGRLLLRRPRPPVFSLLLPSSEQADGARTADPAGPTG